MPAVQMLPPGIIAKANLQGNEYAWRLSDIPAVIDAAREANLLNIGGQLQFRTPDGSTCECYWIEVDTFKSLPKGLAWSERVRRAAIIATEEFDSLMRTKDFLAEANGFEHLRQYRDSGGSLEDAMCFVWYVEANNSAQDFGAGAGASRGAYGRT